MSLFVVLYTFRSGVWIQCGMMNVSVRRVIHISKWCLDSVWDDGKLI